MVVKWYTPDGMVIGSQVFPRSHRRAREYAVITAGRRSMSGIASLEEENHRITFFKMGKKVDLESVIQTGRTLPHCLTKASAIPL